MPKVSVVMTTFRRPDYLRESLAAVLAQTEPDLEVLVCDNAAQPETEAVVAAAGDRRVRYLPRERDLGLVENALDGFRRTTSPLVMKVDDDDLLRPDCVATLAAPFDRHPDLALSAGDFDMIDPSGAPLEAERARMAEITGRDRAPEGLHRPFTGIAARGAVHLVSALLRREAIDWDAVPAGVATSYDLHLGLEAAQDARSAHWTRRRLAGYRIHPASDTRRQEVRQLRGSLVAYQHALDGGRHTDVEVIQDRAAAAALWLGRLLLEAGQPVEAREALRRSLALRPTARAARLLAVASAPSVAQRVVVRGAATLRRRL